MSQSIRIPEGVIHWANGRLEAKDQPLRLRFAEIHEDGQVHIGCTVRKFMVSAEVDVKGRVEGDDGTLRFTDLAVSAENAMVESMIRAALPTILQKARQAVAPASIEIDNPTASA